MRPIKGKLLRYEWVDEDHLRYEVLDECFLPAPGKRLSITWEGVEVPVACVKNERLVAQDGVTPLFRATLMKIGGGRR